MASAREFLLPLRPGLVAVPGVPQKDVCRLCHSSVNGDWPTCYQCSEAGWLQPPEILPISLSVGGELLHHHLRQYKDSPDPSTRERATMRLAALMSVFLAQHAKCVGPWEYVVCVPSATRVAMQPVIEKLKIFEGRHEQVLVGTDRCAGRHLDPSQFDIRSDVAGHTALLVDDTFTSGAKLFSAAAALRNAGATVAGPLVLGRHVQRGWAPSSEMLGWLVDRPWTEERCCRCAGEFRVAPELF